MADDNDFDEWLDDPNADDDGELDQLNIDALLSADQNEESGSSELDQTNIDALLGISTDSPSTETAQDDDNMGELDQDNIDALLNGTDDTKQPDETPAGDDMDELDQDNIDALLNGTDASDDLEELGQDNIDALLSGGSDDLEELDQDNIDALLSGEDTDDIEELDQDNIDALLGGDSDDLDELDQDNIDALLSGSGDAQPSTDNLDEELDQDNIDALLSGGDSDEIAEDLAGDLDQSELDDLFAATATTDETAEPVADPGDDVEQDDIDALFNDIDAATSGDSDKQSTPDDQSVDELFAEGDGGDATTLSSEAANDSAESGFDSEFDEMDQLFSELEDDNPEEDDPFQAEEIDFAEMLDSSSDVGEDEFLSLGDEDEEDELAGVEPENKGDATDMDALLSTDGPQDNEDDGDAKTKKGFVMPAIISEMSKATISAIGGALILLLIIGSYFIFSGGDSAEMTLAQEETIPQEDTTTPPSKQANFIPVVEDNTYAMNENGGELAIELQAIDEDGQPLLYEITSQPSYGRLSGTAPHFTYLANTNFPGEDSFEYTVNDGEDTSGVALISITGPDLKGQALAQKIAEESQKQKIIAKEIKPKKPVVLAKNVHYYTDSTSPISLDWRRIWQQANQSDYDPKIYVEIVKTETAGKLGDTTKSRTTFTPDPYSGSTDLIFYRFKKNGFRSAIKTISIDISLGNPAPEINIATLREGYLVGQSVSLDASQSRDDAPDSLQFNWRQIAGPPVSMHVLENGATMTFVMPSSFYNTKEPGPAFHVTATDKTGKTSSKEVATRSITRRQAALWRGNHRGVAEDPALKGQYFPWPYDD